LASDRDDIVEGIAKAVNGQGFRDSGEEKIVGGFVGGNGWDGEIGCRIKEDIIKVRSKALDERAKDVLGVAKLVANRQGGIDGLRVLK
jgi:hypothetical protein